MATKITIDYEAVLTKVKTLVESMTKEGKSLVTSTLERTNKVSQSITEWCGGEGQEVDVETAGTLEAKGHMGALNTHYGKGRTVYVVDKASLVLSDVKDKMTEVLTALRASQDCTGRTSLEEKAKSNPKARAVFGQYVSCEYWFRQYRQTIWPEEYKRGGSSQSWEEPPKTSTGTESEEGEAIELVDRDTVYLLCQAWGLDWNEKEDQKTLRTNARHYFELQLDIAIGQVAEAGKVWTGMNNPPRLAKGE